MEEAVWVFRWEAKAGELKEMLVFNSVMDLFSRNRRHRNMIEVFDCRSSTRPRLCAGR